MKEDWIGVDLGNTRAKAWCFYAGGSERRFIVPVADADWTEKLLKWRRQVVPPGTADSPSVLWWIASVNREGVSQLQSLLGNASVTAQDRVRLLTHTDVPLPTSLENPELVGIDRLLAAWAAWQALHAPLLVVDAGTAITIDWVDAEPRFRGGAILPGFEMQLAALAEGTSGLKNAVTQLQRRAVNHDGCDHRFPGTNTADAIAAGVYGAVVAAVNAFGQQVTRIAGSPPRVVMTGGALQGINRLDQQPVMHVPNIMRQGLLALRTLHTSS